MIFKARNKYFDLGKKPVLMGILNITPDSFSDGGRFYRLEDAIAQYGRMIREGADIIDIGGESSRPGSAGLSAHDELERILPVIKEIKDKYDACISVDTYKPEVAESALKAGADIINDIYGINVNRDMLEIIAGYSAGVCLMHMRGTPETMQNDTFYNDIVAEIKSGLRSSADAALKCGVKRESVAIDPGIGFGKDLKGNIRILCDLDKFSDLDFPILIGTSRKSFIGKILGNDSEDRLIGTVASNIIALSKGARIFRVHDVKENRSAIDVAFRILKEQESI